MDNAPIGGGANPPKKKSIFSKADNKYREFGLEKENHHLKEQSNILESEIHKM